MDSTTLIDLAHHFDAKLSNLHTAYDLTEAKHDPSCQKLLVSIGKELEGLEGILTQMKGELQKGKEAVSTAQVVTMINSFNTFLFHPLVLRLGLA